MSRLVFTLVISLLSTTLVAGDIYIVQGSAEGRMFNEVERIIWTTDAVFYNTGSTDAVVTLLDVSNGGLRHPEYPISFAIPPHRTATFEGERARWAPAAFDPLWAVHIDVPASVLVESVLFIGSRNEGPTNVSPRDLPARFGKVRLPSFRALTSPGQPQTHLATYLGAEPDIPSRINVGVYNGGTVGATAQIEIRRHCDDTVVSSATVSVAAKSVIQVNNFSSNPGRGCPDASPGPGGAGVYTVVTVDQPSFSFVSNLANTLLPITSISIEGGIP